MSAQPAPSAAAPGASAHAPEPRTWRHYGAYAGMCLIWGSTFLAIRIGNESVAPVWAATLRLAIATVLLAAITVLTRTPFPRGAALQGALLFGFFNFGINFALLYWGELRVPSGIAAIFYATLPLTSGVLAWLFGVHPLDPARTVAAVIGLAGVCIIFAGELALGAPPVALLAVLTAAISAALSGVFLKRAPAQPAIPANAVAAAVGMVFCLVASALLGEPWALPRTAAGWWPLLYLSIAGSLGAFVLWSWLVTQWKLTTVTSGALITPVIAVVLGAAVRGESPAPGTYLGALFVLGGVGETLWVGRAGEGSGADYARILAPPPLVFLAVLGAGLWLAHAHPAPWLPSAVARPLAAAPLLAGGAIALSALAEFRRARTTFLPFRPSAAIVTGGPFRFTRNPLYLSLGCVLLAASLWWNSLWLLAAVPAWVMAMNLLVIRQEEEYLAARFGAPYENFRARVRRWI